MKGTPETTTIVVYTEALHASCERRSRPKLAKRVFQQTGDFLAFRCTDGANMSDVGERLVGSN